MRAIAVGFGAVLHRPPALAVLTAEVEDARRIRCIPVASLPLREDRYCVRAGRGLGTTLLGGHTFDRSFGQGQIERSLEHHSPQEVAIRISMELEPGVLVELSTVGRVGHQNHACGEHRGP